MSLPFLFYLALSVVKHLSLSSPNIPTVYILVRRQCDSFAQLCLAEILLVMYNIPKHCLAAFASIVCSSVKAIAVDEKNFSIRL